MVALNAKLLVATVTHGPTTAALAAAKKHHAEFTCLVVLPD